MLTALEIIERIDIDGFCKVPQVYSQQQVQQALLLAENWKKQVDSMPAENVPFLNQNQPMVYNLQNKDFFFLELLFEPAFLPKVLMHFLNDIWFKQIPQQEPN